MATLVSNLPFMQGYYPHDFESRVDLYLVNRDLTQSYRQGHLDLLKDNPDLTRTHRVQTPMHHQQLHQCCHGGEQYQSSGELKASHHKQQSLHKIEGFDLAQNGVNPPSMAFQ